MKPVLIVGVLFIALSAFIAGLEISGSEDGKKSPENIVLITIEASRADHFSCYGYTRNTTPNICGMKDAKIYTKAFSPSDYTPISLSSLQTGVFPSRSVIKSPKGNIARSYNTAVELFPQYKSVIVANQPMMYGLDNFFQGYDSVENVRSKKIPDFISGEIEGERRFLRLHLMGPHDYYNPYQANPEYDRLQYIEEVNSSLLKLPRKTEKGSSSISPAEKEKIINHYDESLRATDMVVGDILKVLKEKNEYEESLIIITADHGESFNDYGKNIWLHEKTTPPVSHVPLLVKKPEADKRQKSRALTSTIDIYSLLLEYSDIKPSQTVDARPLDIERKLLYICNLGNSCSATDGEKFWMKDLNENDDIEKWNFFRIDNSGGDYQNRSLREILSDRIKKYRENAEERKKRDLNEDLKEKLKDLGYLE